MRNFAKSKSTGDYILVIDGDMELLSFNETELNLDYYICNIRVGFAEFPMIMLYKNVPEISYLGKRHATIEQSCIGRKGGMGDITFSHPELSPEELETKMKHNLEIHLQQLETEPENITVHYHLCRTYFYLKQYEKSIEHGLATLNEKLNKEVKSITCILIYLASLQIGQETVGIHYLYEAIMYIPLQIFARMLLLDFFIKENQQELANDTLSEIKFLNTVKSNLPSDIKLSDFQITNYKQKIKEIKQCQTLEQ